MTNNLISGVKKTINDLKRNQKQSLYVNKQHSQIKLYQVQITFSSNNETKMVLVFSYSCKLAISKALKLYNFNNEEKYNISCWGLDLKEGLVLYSE